jgi:hypothetical protein
MSFPCEEVDSRSIAEHPCEASSVLEWTGRASRRISRRVVYVCGVCTVADLATSAPRDSVAPISAHLFGTIDRQQVIRTTVDRASGVHQIPASLTDLGDVRFASVRRDDAAAGACGDAAVFVRCRLWWCGRLGQGWNTPLDMVG